jgi:hypothetical protein
MGFNVIGLASSTSDGMRYLQPLKRIGRIHSMTERA